MLIARSGRITAFVTLRSAFAARKVVRIRILEAHALHCRLQGLLRQLTMATDYSGLRKSEFWRKKFARAVQVRDTDKSGDISRADFELVVTRYQQLGSSTPQHLANVSKLMMSSCDAIGLTDESVKLSYAEFEEKWSSAILKKAEKGEYVQFFSSMFNNLDLNEDGVISLTEWTAHYQSLGIDTTYARASFDAMDTNGDGKISKEEFVNYHYEFFFTTENKLNSAILYGPI